MSRTRQRWQPCSGAYLGDGHLNGYIGIMKEFWFSSGVGFSETTGYDWTQTSEVTKNEQVTVTVEAEAPPGGFYPSDVWMFPNIDIVLFRAHSRDRTGNWHLWWQWGQNWEIQNIPPGQGWKSGLWVSSESFKMIFLCVHNFLKFAIMPYSKKCRKVWQ